MLHKDDLLERFSCRGSAVVQAIVFFLSASMPGTVWRETIETLSRGYRRTPDARQGESFFHGYIPPSGAKVIIPDVLTLSSFCAF